VNLDKSITLPAAPAEVWPLLLDPEVMSRCVPGMQSVEVLSANEYLAVIRVKISFITAKFKIRTTITEQHEPFYLKTEGAGEDASVASSFRQTSQMYLDDLGDGQTRMRINVHVELLGRLGAFGLQVMKTKADRMWDEFGQNLQALLRPPASGNEAIDAQRGEATAKAFDSESPTGTARSWWPRRRKETPQ